MTLNGDLQTLRLSKIQDPVFQFCIAPSFLGKCITRLHFDEYFSPSTPLQFTTLSYLASTVLPNISTFTGIDNSILIGLCGRSGLLPGPKLSRNGVTFDTEVQHRRNRSVFLRLAAQANVLTLHTDAQQSKVLFSCNTAKLQILGISSTHPREPPILQDPNSPFPALLAQCRGLQGLAISQLHDEDAEGEAPERLTPIHDSALDVSYSFADNLRSLSLDFPHFSYSTLLNEIKFAALFPALETFRITLHGSSLNHNLDTKIVLPSLTSLVMKDVYSIENVTGPLHCLDLPSLSSLRTITPKPFDLFSRSADGLDEAKLAAAALAPFHPTLKHVSITSAQHECARALHHLFALLGGKVAIDYNAKPLHEESRRLSILQSFEQDHHDTKEGAPPPLKDVTSPSALLYDKSKRILKWAADCAENTREKDRVGAKELYRALKPVEELMEWMED